LLYRCTDTDISPYATYVSVTSRFSNDDSSDDNDDDDDLQQAIANSLTEPRLVIITCTT